MIKYAVMVVLDLDVSVQAQIKAQDIEKHTETVVRAQLELAGVGIKMIRAKMLGLAEEKE